MFYLDDVNGGCLLGGQVTSLSGAGQPGNGRSVLNLLGAYRLSSRPPKGDSVCVLMKKGHQSPVFIGLLIQIEPNIQRLVQKYTLSPSLFLSPSVSLTLSIPPFVSVCLTHSSSNLVFFFFSLTFSLSRV